MVSSIQSTANVLSAFNGFNNEQPAISLSDLHSHKRPALLSQKQNPDGGFGNSPSTVYDTALAIMTLSWVGCARDITNNALNYILGLQSEDGSWNESPYQTALAIEAVWKATVDPDLSVKTSDITFIPTSITSLPSNIVINAVIWNTGRTACRAQR